MAVSQQLRSSTTCYNFSRDRFTQSEDLIYIQYKAKNDVNPMKLYLIGLLAREFMACDGCGDFQACSFVKTKSGLWVYGYDYAWNIGGIAVLVVNPRANPDLDKLATASAEVLATYPFYSIEEEEGLIGKRQFIYTPSNNHIISTAGPVWWEKVWLPLTEMENYTELFAPIEGVYGFTSQDTPNEF